MGRDGARDARTSTWLVDGSLDRHSDPRALEGREREKGKSGRGKAKRSKASICIGSAKEIKTFLGEGSIEVMQ